MPFAVDRAKDDDGWLKDYMAGIAKVMDDKAKMVKLGLTRAKARCPICSEKDAMQLSLARNNRSKSGFHVRWICKCGFKGME